MDLSVSFSAWVRWSGGTFAQSQTTVTEFDPWIGRLSLTLTVLTLALTLTLTLSGTGFDSPRCTNFNDYLALTVTLNLDPDPNPDCNPTQPYLTPPNPDRERNVRAWI